MTTSTLFDNTFTKGQQEAIRLAASLEYMFTVLMPHDSPCADSVADEKVLDAVEFYNQLADIALTKLTDIADDCEKVGTQYASVDRIYRDVLEDLDALRELTTRYAELSEGERYD